MDVKTIVKQHGFTLKDVAEKMGISRVTLTQNLQRNPTVNTLQRIADVIGCRVGDFFRDELADELCEHSPGLTCPHCGAKLNISITAEEC